MSEGVFSCPACARIYDECKGSSVAVLEARVAELEKAAESHAFVVASWKREEEAWAEREQQIARALVELVQHVLPFCSEKGAIDRVLAILNGEP